MAYAGPGFYRHYKGNYYEALGVGLRESDLAPCVIYKPVADDVPPHLARLGAEYWIRPLYDFSGGSPESGIDRFTKVPKAEASPHA